MTSTLCRSTDTLATGTDAPVGTAIYIFGGPSPWGTRIVNVTFYLDGALAGQYIVYEYTGPQVQLLFKTGQLEQRGHSLVMECKPQFTFDYAIYTYVRLGFIGT